MSRRDNNASRNRTLGALGGALALGGLGWYVYTTWSSASTSDDRSRDGDGETASGSTSKLMGTKKRAPPPTLSLSLPPTFVCTPTATRLLQQLVSLVSQHYTVTLIAPSSSVRYSGVEEEQRLAAVDYLAMCLAEIATFDPRRILEYEKEEGRFSLARALASDAHCEVMVEHTAQVEADEEGADSLFGNDDDFYNGPAADDGDKTPRAASPVARQVNGVTPGRLVRSDSQNHALNTALENYHAEMARIRKSSGLLIFLLLPLPAIKMDGRRNKTNTSNMWTVDIESVLRPFLMPGQRDLSARVPGVKVIDERLPIAVSAANEPPSPSIAERSTLDRAWLEAANRIGQLGQGWS